MFTVAVSRRSWQGKVITSHIFLWDVIIIHVKHLFPLPAVRQSRASHPGLQEWRTCGKLHPDERRTRKRLLYLRCRRIFIRVSPLETNLVYSLGVCMCTLWNLWNSFWGNCAIRSSFAMSEFHNKPSVTYLSWHTFPLTLYMLNF